MFPTRNSATAASLAALLSGLLLAGCGGGGDAGDAGVQQAASSDATDAAADDGTGPAIEQAAAATPTITPAQRTAAAAQVAATNAYCKITKPFYWEIGDKNGALSTGKGGTGTVAAPTANTVMAIASASKWIFATYVVEKQQGVLSVHDVKHLNMTSGYTNFNICSANSTVSSCLSERGAAGGTNGDYIAKNDGRFYYNGGHMQNLGDYVGLGQNARAALGVSVKKVLGTTLPLSFNLPQLPGGADLSPAGYAQILRNILSGKYPHMQKLLGSNAVCTHANSKDCPTAVYSPTNQPAPGQPNSRSNVAYHYSLGHWVEDDPADGGDGAFSSMGKAGFYPWIDKTKTYYGVVAPNDPQALTDDFGSAEVLRCGQAIRRAWIAGTSAAAKK